jgi:hypothetical protein
MGVPANPTSQELELMDGKGTHYEHGPAIPNF